MYQYRSNKVSERALQMVQRTYGKPCESVTMGQLPACNILALEQQQLVHSIVEERWAYQSVSFEVNYGVDHEVNLAAG